MNRNEKSGIISMFIASWFVIVGSVGMLLDRTDYVGLLFTLIGIAEGFIGIHELYKEPKK